MKNITTTLKGDILTIQVDVSKSYGLSGSGKSIIIASTEGNVSLEGHDDVKLGINIYKKAQ